MKKAVVLILPLFIIFTSPVMAEEQFDNASTGFLYGACMDFVYQDETLTTSAHCKAFIQGAINAHKHLTSHHKFPNQFCLPPAVSEKKVIRILLKFIEGNQNFINKPAILTLFYVLEETFPCAQSKSSR